MEKYYLLKILTRSKKEEKSIFVSLNIEKKAPNTATYFH